MFSFLNSTFEFGILDLVKHEAFATFSGLEHENFCTFSLFEHETIDLVGHELFSFEFSTFEQERLDSFGLDILLTFKLHTLYELLLY